MTLFAFGHPLDILSEGANVIRDDEASRLPLIGTMVSVDVDAGLAIISITRAFENIHQEPIEAILTMPSSFDAVLTGLAADVDGRHLVAVAEGVSEARFD